MENETWKDIPGYEGFYMASSLGNIKGLNYRNTGTSKNVVLIKNKWGYLRIRLQVNKRQKTYMVHRLIAYTFLNNDNSDLQINHINGIKDDNRPCNLEWVTAKENIAHAYANGLIPKKSCKYKGMKRGHFPSMFKPVYIVDIYGNIIKEFESVTKAAIETKSNASKISLVCRGLRKQTNNLIFKYKNQ